MFLKNRYLYPVLFILVFLFGCSDDREAAVSEVSELEQASENSVNLINNEEEKKVDVWIHDTFFTSYHYADTFKKPILYPIYTAEQTPVTRGFPLAARPGESEDHPHQVGLWLNYGDVNGLDFWNHSDAIPEERKEHYGTIVHKGITNINSGGQGELEVLMEWVGPDNQTILVENTTFIFSGNQNANNAGAGKRVIDRITRLTATDTDVSLTDNKEGMLGIRMARELEHPDEHNAATGMYLSSEGLTGHDVWGTRARWMNLAGVIDNEHVSVTMLDHPENTGYPTYWHARGYGLFAANPLGMKEMSGGEEELNYSLTAGESVEFKYRIIIWSGEEISGENIQKVWENWVEN